jgi:hypothetical protein
MTKTREEQLISDVGETKGMVAQLIKEFDNLKPNIATHTEVIAVERKIDKHIENHQSRLSTVIAAIAGIGGLIVSIIVAAFKRAI